MDNDAGSVEYDDNPSQVTDGASRELVDALQWLFRLLKLIMVVVVGFYVFSGVFHVRPEQVALKLRFGEVLSAGLDHEFKPGLHWSFPWPIDSRIVVPKGKQRVAVSEFWYKLTDQEKVSGAGKRAGRSLVPGRDHFVLTADVNILHIDVAVRYRIVDAHKYVRGIIAAEHPETEPERDLIVSLANSAIIRAAGQFAVEDLITAKKMAFSVAVGKYIREALSALDCGLDLDDVLINKIDPPRQVAKAFNQVRSAAEQKRAEIERARGDATKLLAETAQADYMKLVRAMELEREMIEKSDPRAKEAQATVVDLLERTLGSAQKILREAEDYRSELVERAKANAEYIESVVPQFDKHPEVLVTRLLLGTLEELLGDVDKWYLTSSVREVRIITDRDPNDVLADQARSRQQENRGAR